MKFLLICLLTMVLAGAGCASSHSAVGTDSGAAPGAMSLDPADPGVARLRQDIRRMIAVGRDRVFPALVNINVVSVRYVAGGEQKQRSVGSGTIISPDGYVVTNYHVTARGAKFTCTLADRRQVSAVLVGEDPLTDIAVLKLEPDVVSDGKPTVFPYARFGDSAALQVGDYVMAMGSPFSLSRSVTLGIVSNTTRVFAGGLMGDDVQEMELEPGQSTGLFTRWIQHDALIHPGNSGGPLVNLRGQIIGVNELGGSGIGYAIPSNLTQSVVAAIIKHGEVPRSWIGIAFKPIERTGLTEGVLVNSVVKDGPADAAGIKPGDIILDIGVERVTARFAEEVPPLLQRISDEPVGNALPVLYQRDGQTHMTNVITRAYEADMGEQKSFRSWGFSAQGITQKIAMARGLPDKSGVMLTSTKRGGPADRAEPSVGGGDIIRQVDGQTVADMAGFVEAYSRIMDAKPTPEKVTLSFDRGGENLVTIIKPTKDEEFEPPRELPKAWLGLATQPVLAELAKELAMPADSQGGFRITRIYPGTEAAQSDLRVGDVIIAVDALRLRPRGMQDANLLETRIRQLDVGDSPAFTVVRQGEVLKIPATLEKTRTTPAEARRDSNGAFGLSVREITFFDRDARRWDQDVQGVVVTDADGAGWAGIAGIQPGDLIQRIGDQAVTDLDTYRSAMARLATEQPARIVFVVLRGPRTGFQYVEPDWKPTSQAAQ